MELPDQILYWQADIKTPMDGRRGYKTVVLLEWDTLFIVAHRDWGKNKKRKILALTVVFSQGKKQQSV